MRFRRALDRENVTEALSAASELGFVGLAEALELTLLLADKEPAKYDRAAARWHVRFLEEVPNVDCARAKPCSRSSLRSRRTAWPQPLSPSFSAAGGRASGLLRLLRAGRVEGSDFLHQALASSNRCKRSWAAISISLCRHSAAR
jgi:hypothetical protein